jgi:CrcB protein
VVDSLVSARGDGVFPYGTMVVNVSGSFVLGLLTGLATYHGMPRAPRLVLGTGFVGAYTTFSTFSFETMQLVERGDARPAMANVAASAVAGGLAAAAGLALAAL